MNSNESNPNVPQGDWLADLLVPGPEATKDANRSAFATAPTELKPAMSEAFPSSLPTFHSEADRPAPAVSPVMHGVAVAPAAPADRLKGSESGSVSGRIKRRWVMPFLLGAATMFAGEAGARHFWNPNFLRFGAAIEVSKTEQRPAEPGAAAATMPVVAANPPATPAALNTPAGPTAPAANAAPANGPGSPTAAMVASSPANPTNGSTPTSPGATSYPSVDDLLMYFQKPASSLSPPRPSP